MFWNWCMKYIYLFSGALYFIWDFKAFFSTSSKCSKVSVAPSILYEIKKMLFQFFKMLKSFCGALYFIWHFKKCFSNSSKCSKVSVAPSKLYEILKNMLFHFLKILKSCFWLIFNFKKVPKNWKCQLFNWTGDKINKDRRSKKFCNHLETRHERSELTGTCLTVQCENRQ